MPGQASVLDLGFNAAVVINKYQAVVLDTTTDNQVTMPTNTANGNHFIGIAQEDVDPVNYDPMLNVRVQGTSFAIASGAITRGDTVCLSATPGQLESVQGGAVATPNVVGKALTSAVAAGDQFLVLVIPSNY